MPLERPHRPSHRVQIALAVALLVTFVYSVVIAAQILLWVIFVGIVGGIYVAWLLAVAAFRLVAAVERIATAMEADAGLDSAPGRERVADEE